METYACTDRGKIREGNEDAIYCNAVEGIFIVADGMGGHYGGEIASQIAVEVLASQLLASQSVNDEVVADGFSLANEKIYATAEEQGHQLMGTTASLLYVSKDASAKIGHVGDSRIYLYRDSILQQLTKDHSFVQELVDSGKITQEEAFFHPNRNIITRALGTQAEIETDLMHIQMRANDIYLLCSDGLSGKIQDDEMAAVLEKSGPLKGKGEELLGLALERGGEDNISLILLEITGTEVEA